MKNNSDTTNLDERGAAEEETKHVGHNVITDHAGNWHNEPIQTKKSWCQSHTWDYDNVLYETRHEAIWKSTWILQANCLYMLKAYKWIELDFNIIRFYLWRTHQREEAIDSVKLYSIKGDEGLFTHQIIPSNRLWMIRWDWVTTISRVTWVQPNCGDNTTRLTKYVYTGSQYYSWLWVFMLNISGQTGHLVKTFSETSNFPVIHHPNITANSDCTEMGSQGQNLAAATAKTWPDNSLIKSTMWLENVGGGSISSSTLTTSCPPHLQTGKGLRAYSTGETVCGCVAVKLPVLCKLSQDKHFNKFYWHKSKGVFQHADKDTFFLSGSA